MDGISGRAKSLLRSAVMSKRKSAPVVQSASDFAAVGVTVNAKHESNSH